MRKILCFFMCILLMSDTVCAIDISAQHACVIETVTGKVLYEKNANERAPMASTTKIMTAVVALENSSLDEVVTISKNAAYQEGSSAYFRIGDKIKMEDALYGLMLNSGNDAAVAIAEHISENCDDFSILMNKKAEEIGAKNTRFVNPNGLYDTNHYTTAYDLAKITAYAMENETFCEIVSSKTKEIIVENTGVKMYFSNHNKLLKTYEGADGVKTGFTKNSGRCLVSSASRDGINVIAVTLNAPNDWIDHKNLLDEAFSDVKIKTIVNKGEMISEKEIDGVKVGVISASTVCVPLVGAMGEYKLVTHIAKGIKAPVNSGEKVGVCDVVYDNKIVRQFDLLCDTEIYKKTTILDFLKNLFK